LCGKTAVILISFSLLVNECNHKQVRSSQQSCP
jgi:hypothetical protein